MPAKVTVNLHNLKQLQKAVKKLKNAEVRIGVEEGATEASGVPVSQVATWLEYGWTQTVTQAQRGWLGVHGVHLRKETQTLTLPPRPTFKATAETHKSKWIKTFNFAMKSLAKAPDIAIKKGLIMVGEQAQGDVQDTIINNGTEGHKFAPRSGATTALLTLFAQGHKVKGKNNTTTEKALKNTGTFLHSIVYEIKGL